MNYIDVKYITLVSGNLRNFKKKGDKLWNFSCPICGDSQKRKTKARGYIYEAGNNALYKCHNCGVSCSFHNFLKKISNKLFEDYRLEKYKTPKNIDLVIKKKSSPLTFGIFFNRHFYKNLKCVNDLPDNHIARKYCSQRKIPKRKLSSLYYTNKFMKFTNNVISLSNILNKFQSDKLNLKQYSDEELVFDEPRLIIPFVDSDGDIIGYQGRSFNPKSSLKYVTVKLNKSKQMIYGLNTVDRSKPFYVVEGPLDSLFLPNSVAVATASLSSRIKDKNAIYIFDNQKRNPEIVKLMRKCINDDFKIFIWCDRVEEKDVNELVQNGYSPIEAKRLIDNNTYIGLNAMTRFNEWRKC